MVLPICPICKKNKDVEATAYHDLDGWHIHFYCTTCDEIIKEIDDYRIPQYVSEKWLRDKGFTVR